MSYILIDDDVLCSRCSVALVPTLILSVITPMNATHSNKAAILCTLLFCTVVPINARTPKTIPEIKVTKETDQYHECKGGIWCLVPVRTTTGCDSKIEIKNIAVKT